MLLVAFLLVAGRLACRRPMDTSHGELATSTAATASPTASVVPVESPRPPNPADSFATTDGATETAPTAPATNARYRWLRGDVPDTVASRFTPPAGYARMPQPEGSFGAWLRGLPLRPGRPVVHLYNGLVKPAMDVHEAVVLMDVGDKDLQQCADAVIRLRAEYLFSIGCEHAIAFSFTSGDPCEWPRWKEGLRPSVAGSRVSWKQTAPPDGSYRSFRRYLDTVFTYAGSASLSRELERVPDPSMVEVGDVFIMGGFPGHAVVVVDTAEDAEGRREFLIAQSYMPAQEVHVLRNPAAEGSPWYAAAASGSLRTPEWVFQYTDLKRFAPAGCRP